MPAAARRGTRESAAGSESVDDHQEDRFVPKDRESDRKTASTKLAVENPQEEPADEFGAGIL